jgi:hypothetical protein
MADNKGIVQDNPGNRNAPLKVKPLSFTIKIDVGPNPLVHGKSFVAITVIYLLESRVFPDGDQVVPFSRIETTGDFSGKVDILDQLGNRVISGDLVPGSGSASSMYFHWNGRNRKGRVWELGYIWRL